MNESFNNNVLESLRVPPNNKADTLCLQDPSGEGEDPWNSEHYEE